MKRKNTTRNALVMSVLSMLLCVSMLVGTTFAWFTDEVVTGMNTIAAGNLDIEVTNDAGESIQNVDELFEDITLWEPGVVAYENLHVSNEGTLALKYDLKINFANQNYVTDNGLGLADVLKVAVIEGTVTGDNREELVNSVDAADWALLSDLTMPGELLPGEEEAFAIVIWWEPSDLDNQWNVNNGRTTSDGQPLHIDLGIHVFATQLMYEEDSFGNNYDEMLPEAGLRREPSLENIAIQWGSYGQWSPSYPNDQTLDAVYVFTAPHDGTTVQDSKYKDWYCDFVVSLDRPTTEDANGVGDLFLGGNYGSFGWVGFEAPAGIAAGEEVPLLGSVTTNPWTYEDVATLVGTFTCGVGRTYGSDMSKLDGATFTVKLQLTNPENGEVFTVAEVKYTFVNKVSTAAELKTLLAAGYDVVLANDIALDKNDTITIAAGNDVTIDLNGYELSASADKTGNQEAFLVKGNLTVKNGSMEMTALNNQGWGAMATIFDVTAGGVLNLEGVTATTSGTDMAFVAHLNNWGEVTLNAKDCIFETNYVAIRVFNSGYDMNNVTLENCYVKGASAALWVHNYTEADFGTAAKADAQKALLNFNLTGNTFVGNSAKAGPIRLGFTDAIYGGVEILP